MRSGDLLTSLKIPHSHGVVLIGAGRCMSLAFRVCGVGLVQAINLPFRVADAFAVGEFPKCVRHDLLCFTDAKVLYHSCGAVSTLIPDFLDMGIDFINPVQVSAAGMETAKLKQEYGDQLGFCGAVDTMHVLPHGTPEDVRAEVRQRIRDLAPGGGYVITAVHNIQPDVPPENIVTMYDSARELGKYPITA